MNDHYIPIILRSEKLNTLIIGGGKVAYRKAITIHNKVKSLTVVSPDFHEGFDSLRNVQLKKRKYLAGDLDDIDLLYVALNDPQERDKINQDIKTHPQIIANFVDYPRYCDFYTPAKIELDDILISVSSKGKAPEAAKELKDFLKENIDWNLWQEHFKKKIKERKND